MPKPRESDHLRLDKYLSHATGLSRSLAKKAIREGEVHVNGMTCRNPGNIIHQDDQVLHLGKNLEYLGTRYLMLNKPDGYVCATRDKTNPTVLDLLDLPHSETLHIAGRLDIDTTGLVLITDDGEWSHRVTSNKKKCAKVYHVGCSDPIDDGQIKTLKKGMLLKGERRRTLPAEIQMITPTECLLTITEGKYHQVKRMFAAVGNFVVSLHREKIGDIRLDPELQEGEWRFLTRDEINSVLEGESTPHS